MNYKKLLISLLAPQIAGLIGSLAVFSSVDSWYLTLVKPSFNPPNWLFQPVWIILYFLMGVSVYIVWNKKRTKEIKYLVDLFWIHLFFNAFWSIQFFGFKSVSCAFYVLLVILCFIILFVLRFWKIDKRASILLVPYLVWTFFAGILNGWIWILN